MSVIFHEWYNKNELTAYPLDGSATKISDAGELLPDNILVDAHIQFPSSLGAYLVLSSVTVSPSLVTATFSAATGHAIDDPEPVFVPICAVAVPRPLVVYRNYAVQPMADGVAGWVAFGSGAADTALRSYTFTRPKQATLCPRAAHRYPVAAVTSIGRVLTTQKLVGDVQLRGKGDLIVEAAQRTIDGAVKDVILVHLDTEGATDTLTRYAGPCYGRPETGTCNRTPIKTLAGVVPDCDGNINIVVRDADAGASSLVPVISIYDVAENEGSLPDGTIVFESVVGINDICPPKDERLLWELDAASSSSVYESSSVPVSSSGASSEVPTCPPLPEPYCEAFDTPDGVACYWNPLFGTWILWESSSSIIASSSSAQAVSSSSAAAVASSSSLVVPPTLCAYDFTEHGACGTYTYAGQYDGAPMYQSDAATPWYLFKFAGMWVIAMDPGGSIWYYREESTPDGEYTHVETDLADGTMVEGVCPSSSLVPVASSSLVSSSSQVLSSSLVPEASSSLVSPSSLVPSSSSSAVAPSSSLQPAVSSSSQVPSSSAVPVKNIILIVGDGMGDDYAKAASLYYHGTEDGLSFQGMPFSARVAVKNATGGIPDSAAGGTVLFTGTRTSNGAVSMKYDGGWTELPTMLEACKALGMRTGLVTTSFITDATVACLAAHNSSRYNYSAIATSILATKPNVLFGGADTWLNQYTAAAAGYTVAVNRLYMDYVLTGADYAAGIFGNGQFPYVDNRGSWMPSLEQMAMKAIELLADKGSGFFLMIENELTDSAGEENDLLRTVAEVKEIADTTTAVLEWAAGRDDTLVIVLADHETGGLRVLESNGVGVLPTVYWEAGSAHSARAPLVYGYGPGAGRLCGELPDTQFYSVVMDELFSSSCPSSSLSSFGGDGVIGKYYQGVDFDVEKLIRTDPQVFFDWGVGSPDPLINPGNFSVRWFGEITPRYTEQYFFYLQSDDGVRLYVNDTLVISDWTEHSAAWNAGYVTLAAGERYRLRVEYFDGTGDAVVKLYWASARQLFESIPTDCMFAIMPSSSSSSIGGTGLFGAYFSNKELTLPAAFTRTDPTLDFSWSSGPGSSVPSTDFSVRWTGYVVAPSAGDYTFYVTSDDGVRVWINDVLVISRWTDHGPTEDSVTLALGAGEQDIRVEYYNAASSGVLKLEWELSGVITREVIPQDNLFPAEWSGLEPVRGFIVGTDGFDTPETGVCLTWQYGNSWTGRFLGTHPDLGCHYWVDVFLNYTGGMWTFSALAYGTIPSCPAAIKTWSAAGDEAFPPATVCGEPEHVAFSGTSGYAYLEYECDSSCSLVPDSSLSTGCPAPGAAVYDSSSSKWMLPSCSSESIVEDGDGLLARYTSGGAPKHIKIDTAVDFSWEGVAPAPDVPVDGWAAEWEGFVRPGYTEEYTFHVQSDAPVQLYINGTLIVDNWAAHSIGWDSGSIVLSAGVYYPITVLFQQTSGNAHLVLEWESATQAREVVPQGHLYTPGHPAEDQDIIHLDVNDTSAGSFSVTGALLQRSGANSFSGIYSTGGECSINASLVYQGGWWLLQLTWPDWTAYEEESCANDVGEVPEGEDPCTTFWRWVTYGDPPTPHWHDVGRKSTVITASATIRGFTVGLFAFGSAGNPPTSFTGDIGTASINYGKGSYSSLRTCGPLQDADPLFGCADVMSINGLGDPYLVTSLFDAHSLWESASPGSDGYIQFVDGFWVMSVSLGVFKKWGLVPYGSVSEPWYGPDTVTTVKGSSQVYPTNQPGLAMPCAKAMARWSYTTTGCEVGGTGIATFTRLLYAAEDGSWDTEPLDHVTLWCPLEWNNGYDIYTHSQWLYIDPGSFTGEQLWARRTGGPGFNTASCLPFGAGGCSDGCGTPDTATIVVTPLPYCLPPTGYDPLTDEDIWEYLHPGSSSSSGGA